MSDDVSTDLIDRQARELQDIELTPERTAELAVEVGRYNREVAQAARGLDFDEEPADFTRVLRRLRRDPPQEAG